MTRNRWVLVLLMVLILAGCSSVSRGSAENAAQIRENHEEKTKEKDQPDQESAADSTDSDLENTVVPDFIHILSYSDYSKKYAMIQYDEELSDGSTSRTVSYMDRKGVIRPITVSGTRYKGWTIEEGNRMENFQEGYSSVFCDRWILQVDEDLNGWTYQCEENEKVLDTGGEYVLIDSNTSGYSQSSAAVILYEIADGNITELQRLEYDPKTDRVGKADYLGHGIFALCMDNGGGFFTAEKGLQEAPLVTVALANHFADKADLTVTGIYQDEPTTISWIDSQGNLGETRIDEYCWVSNANWSDWITGTISEHGGMGETRGILTCNLKTQEKHILSGDYDVDSRMKPAGVDENNQTAIQLRGEDREQYVGLFDSSLNLIGDPVKGELVGQGCGLTLVNEDGTFKAILPTGRILFELDEYSWICPFRNGAAVVSLYYDEVEMPDSDRYETSTALRPLEPSEVVYLDVKGDRMFDTVRMEVMTE